jgi:hypothetical protein
MNPFTAYTHKPVSNEAVGGRLWLITGERISKGKLVRFYLRSSFVIISTGQSDSKGFDTQITGNNNNASVWDRAKMPPLNDEEWFPRLRKTQFWSLGFHRISDLAVISGLKKVLRSGTSVGE